MPKRMALDPLVKGSPKWVPMGAAGGSRSVEKVDKPEWEKGAGRAVDVRAVDGWARPLDRKEGIAGVLPGVVSLVVMSLVLAWCVRGTEVQRVKGTKVE
jgi:hypothetical protein